MIILFHISKKQYLKFELLDIFQSLLKILPVDFIQKKENLNSIDLLSGQMTTCFHSFVYILFIDALQNMHSFDYLTKLIQFLVFFIEEELYIKENFLIF